MKKNKNKYKMGPLARLITFLAGIGISVYILLYSFQFSNYPIQVFLIGSNITQIFIGTMIVLLGVLAGTLIKSGILGSWKLD